MQHSPEHSEKKHKNQNRSPFLVDLVAENERIDEENKVRLNAITRKKKALERKKEQAKNEIILRALQEGNELENLRMEKRKILDEEKRLKRRSKVVPSTSTADDSEQKGGEDNGAIVDNEAPTASRRLRPKTKIIKPTLPTFDYLLTLERGLVTVLESDCLHVWNAHYGSNSTVALWTLRSLAAG